MQVILESLRMASIISFTFREAVADVEYKGKHVFNMDWESVYTVLESLNKS
jgi:cytochrome P450